MRWAERLPEGAAATLGAGREGAKDATNFSLPARGGSRGFLEREGDGARSRISLRNARAEPNFSLSFSSFSAAPFFFPLAGRA